MLALALAAAPLSATAQQAKLDARYETAIWHIAEIWPAGSQNVRWIYSESWLKDAQAPYMQRVSRVELQQDGSLVARRYAITQPERVVGAWQTPSKFAALTSAASQPAARRPGVRYTAAITKPSRPLSMSSRDLRRLGAA